MGLNGTGEDPFVEPTDDMLALTFADGIANGTIPLSSSDSEELEDGGESCGLSAVIDPD
jgi:hypothetical protein